jgi:hypothetical protein
VQISNITSLRTELLPHDLFSQSGLCDMSVNLIASVLICGSHSRVNEIFVVMPCSWQRRSQSKKPTVRVSLLPSSPFLYRFIFGLWRWRRNVPPKHPNCTSLQLRYPYSALPSQGSHFLAFSSNSFQTSNALQNTKSSVSGGIQLTCRVHL